MTAKAVTLEKGWQAAVTQLLDTLGWVHTHTYPLRTLHGWRTGTTAKGWPDLVALKGRYIIGIELKSDTGRPTRQQLEWLTRFGNLGHGRGWLITPSVDLTMVARWLVHPEDAPRHFGY